MRRWTAWWRSAVRPCNPMSIEPAEFLASAEEMASDHREVMSRNAISRAYYAAFHQVQLTFPAVEGNGSNLPGAKGMHRRFIDQLNQGAPGSLERKLGVMLETLRKRRVSADYRLADDIPAADVAQQLDRARIVLGLCG